MGMYLMGEHRMGVPLTGVPNGKLGKMGREGDDGQLARAVWLHLHYNWLRHKPHGPVHGPGPGSALQLGTKDNCAEYRTQRRLVVLQGNRGQGCY